MKNANSIRNENKLFQILKKYSSICLNCCNNQDYELMYFHNVENCQNLYFDKFLARRNEEKKLVVEKNLLKANNYCFQCLLSTKICYNTRQNNEYLYENVIINMITLI